MTAKIQYCIEKYGDLGIGRYQAIRFEEVCKKIHLPTAEQVCEYYGGKDEE